MRMKYESLNAWGRFLMRLGVVAVKPHPKDKTWLMAYFRWWHPLTYLVFLAGLVWHGLSNAGELWREMFPGGEGA